MKHVDRPEIRLHQEAYLEFLREEVERKPHAIKKARHLQRQDELRSQRQKRQALLKELAERTVAYSDLPNLRSDAEDNCRPLWNVFCSRVNPHARQLDRAQRLVRELQRNQEFHRDRLVRNQAQAAILDTEIVQLEAVVARRMVESGIEQVRQTIDEYIALLSLPDVVRLEYGPDREFHLFVNPRVEHRGRLYDFGDWKLVFGSPRREQPTMVCLRSGALASYKERMRLQGYPRRTTPYYYPDQKDSWRWRENQFCLNSRLDTVISYLTNGNWLEAITTACEALRSLSGYMTDRGYTISKIFTDLGPVPQPDSTSRCASEATTTDKENIK